MIDRRGSDDEVDAQIRKSIRTEARFFWSLLILVSAVSAILVGVLKFQLPMESSGIAAMVVLLAWVGFVFHTSRTVPPAPGQYDEDTLRRTIDDQQRRWRWFFGFMFCVVGGLAVAISLETLRPLYTIHLRSGVDPLAAVLTMELAFAAIVAAFQVCFGPGFFTGAYRRALNDEFTRALQYSAAMFGYLFCVVVMCGVLGVMAMRPQWGVAAMPGAVGAAVILPGVYFLIRQWRAGRDG
jgi:hypothetical protein